MTPANDTFAHGLTTRALRRHLRFSVVNAANDNADAPGAA